MYVGGRPSLFHDHPPSTVVALELCSRPIQLALLGKTVSWRHDCSTLVRSGARSDGSSGNVGSSVAAAAYAVARAAAIEMATTGGYDTLAGELDYGTLTGLFR